MAERLERRYEVRRIGDDEGKHNICWYFVLDPRHDIHAAEALRHYAVTVARYQPELARDIIYQLECAAMARADDLAKRHPKAAHNCPGTDK